MYAKLKRMYQQKLLDEEALQNAVNKSWITEEQMKEIINSITE